MCQKAAQLEKVGQKPLPTYIDPVTHRSLTRLGAKHANTLVVLHGIRYAASVYGFDDDEMKRLCRV
jgi:hypothetical protein